MSNLRIGSFVMIKITRGLSILPLAAILVLSQGCALKPKPSELEALEKLRATPSAAAALKLKSARAKTAAGWSRAPTSCSSEHKTSGTAAIWTNQPMRHSWGRPS